MDAKLDYPGHAEPLLDADPDAHRDARDRLPQPPRRQGLRPRRGGDRAGGDRARAGPRGPAGDAQRLRRAALRAASTSTSAPIATRPRATGCASRDVHEVVETAIGGRDVSQRRRGPRALSDQRALCARFPRGPRRARARPGRDARRARRSRSASSPSSSSRWARPSCAAKRASSWASSRSTPGDQPIVDYVHDAKQALRDAVGASGRRTARVGRAVPALRARARAARVGRAADAARWSRCCSTSTRGRSSRRGSCCSRCPSR